MKPENKAKEATLYLYDEISFWGINSQDFVKEINAQTADVIHLRIDSPGGDVFAARAIQTALKQHPAKVVAHIDGLAASAASVIAMGADEVEIVDGGFVMIHSALSFFDILGYFNSGDLASLIEDMSKERELLDKVDGSIANDYAKRTGKTADEVLSAMKDETWFTAGEAVAYGLADRVYDGVPKENRHDLSIYTKTPDCLQLGVEGPPSKRRAEKALRDAGFSQVQAKAILASGFSEQREVAEEPAPEHREDVTEPEPVNVAPALDDWRIEDIIQSNHL